MGTKSAGFAVIAFAVAIFFAAPAGIAAEGRKGADLVVTRLDGTLVSGELIAVKTDSLLLLAAGGADLSVPLRDIRTVRIVRRSKAGTFGLVGGAAGLIGMGGFVLAYADSDVVGSKAGAAVVYGLLAGAAGAAAGAIAGAAAGADSVFIVAGQPAEVLADYWARLAARSRMGRASSPAAGRGGAKGPAHGSRFRLNLAMRSPIKAGTSLGGPGAFRFPEETAPEAGPYPLSLSGYSHEGSDHLKPGPLGIAYDWRANWAAEIEIMPFRLAYNYVQGDMAFTSSLDGLPYGGYYYSEYTVDCLALLVGLSYRPIASSALQRHAVEAGLAFGPAFVSLKNAGEGTFLLPSASKLAVSARIKAAYDFYIVPAFSLGAFAGYLYTEASFSGLEGSMMALFTAAAEPYTELHRPTTTALPDLPVKAGGFYWGLRVSFRI
jgi:hypothetical protein